MLPISASARRVGRLVSEHEKKNHVSVRLDPDTIKRIDAILPRFTTSKHVGTRSDVVRALILAGLEHRRGKEDSALPEPEDAAGPPVARTRDQ